MSSIDTLISDAIAILDNTAPERADALRRCNIVVEPLPEGNYAQYRAHNHTVVVSSLYLYTGADATELAGALFHEAGHAIRYPDSEAFEVPNSERLAEEVRENHEEAEWWIDNGHPTHNEISAIENMQVGMLENGVLDRLTLMQYSGLL